MTPACTVLKVQLESSTNVHYENNLLHFFNDKWLTRHMQVVPF
jgi:hypothetical protein